MKDSKAILKEAREAIKNKDYDTSLKLSKTILKADKSNYMALVFLGLSLQEVGPKDQAPKAFKKAIQECSDNPLAWNGLINYYEKNTAENCKKDLLEAYLTMLKIETVDKKIVEYCEKILSLLEHGDLENIAKTMFSVAGKENPSENLVFGVLEILVKILETSKELNEELTDIYEKSLNLLLNNRKFATSEIYSAYLAVLNKKDKSSELFENAAKMYSIFSSNTISLVWICKVFNRWYVEEDQIYENYKSKAFEYCSKLLKIEPENTMGLFTKSIEFIEDDNTIEAVEILEKVTTLRPGLIHAWFLLTKLYIELNLFEVAFHTLTRSEKLLQSINFSNKILKNQLDVMSLNILSRSQNMEDWEKALSLYEKIDNNEVKKKCKLLQIRAKINMGKYSEVQSDLQELKTNENLLKYTLLYAYFLYKQSKYQECIEFLEQKTFEDSEYWLQLGQIHFENNSDKTASLMPFLKAAKCSPNNYLCFLHLGNYYQSIKDFDKSRRCYEKAFKLNSKSSEAGIQLSKVYMELKNWEASKHLLESLTQTSINKNNSWAWFQLGLSYLEQNEYEKAIDRLRFVVRVEQENPHCWEALADSYFARGSYTSALKCYQKASELSEDTFYPSLQIATIKQILGEYAEAREEFSEILKVNQNDVLALKGLAETCMCQARHCLKEQRLGTARSHAQYASEKITQAIKKNYGLVSLWKLLAESCQFVAKLPEKHSILSISKFIYEEGKSEGNVFLETTELFKFALRCYRMAIALPTDIDSSKSHIVPTVYDLAVCYLNYSQSVSKKEQQELLLHAKSKAECCISQDATSWQYWNLLGNIAMKFEQPKFALAQHAFIKAVEADHNAAISWCNLGILYFLKDDVKLANKCFAEGQRSDPNYVNSWIGQALIAERLGRQEAMDLFRHSTQLDTQQQGGLGYGHWVCQTLIESKPNEKIYSIHNMHAIPVACDALTWYTEKNPDNSCAWNMLGILKERLGLLKGAEVAFKNAYRQTDKGHRDQARINYGRILYRNGKYTKAIEMFANVQEATTKSGSGLALALFKDQQYEDSYNAYDQALHWLTDEEGSQSDMLVALASMAYMFQGKEAAKTLLLQSLELKPPSVWGLYSTLSLGLLHKDIELATLVIFELNKLKDNKDCLKHYSLLLSYIYLLQGDSDRASIEISKLIHRHPDQASVWYTLSVLLVRTQEKKKAKAAAKCAIVAMRLGQTTMDVSKVLCLVSMASLTVGDVKTAKIAAQKAVHYYPNLADTWAVLASTLSCQESDGKKLTLNICKHIENLAPTVPLKEWTKQTMSCV
ncbi:unnamed protein product [Brassicogethes aeneus]|uniref:Tetratricopeptide repeat protein 37 n=1 Tax=Brassicogethes aeneus TaxID=1431903 RepID=A0A9P0FCX5_BRAAE|nr:unnamed protein product [Brassicogethes aeneus]